MQWQWRINQLQIVCGQVPFGKVAAVKNWLQISGAVYKPNPEHPKRPIWGFDCTRSEVFTAQCHVTVCSLMILEDLCQALTVGFQLVTPMGIRSVVKSRTQD